MMAYLCGLLSKEEKKDMEDRGWEFERAPNVLRPKDIGEEYEFVMVWVDNDLFNIMNGPDWEPPRSKQE